MKKFLFAYIAPNRCDGVCRIERLELDDGRVVVICEELKKNPGMSITNAVEAIAFQVCAQFGIDPGELIWIEHYRNVFNRGPSWMLVTFQSHPPASMFTGPSWRPMTPEDWKALGLKPRGTHQQPGT